MEKIATMVKDGNKNANDNKENCDAIGVYVWDHFQLYLIMMKLPLTPLSW